MWRRFTPLIAILLAATSALRAELFLRWNQAGYASVQPKVLVALSDADLAGNEWTVRRDGETVKRGAFGPSVTGEGDHTPFAFNHTADFSAVTAAGDYEIVTVGAPPAKYRVATSPYGE